MYCLKNVLILITLILVGFSDIQADILEIQTRRVTVKNITSDSVTFKDGDSVLAISVDLLNTMTVEVGDSLVWEGYVHKVWKIYPGEEWVTGVIITQKDTSGIVEITVNELDSGQEHAFRLAMGPFEIKPGDTLTVVQKFDYLVRRPTPESSLETRTDTSRQRYQIADHRPKQE